MDTLQLLGPGGPRRQQSWDDLRRQSEENRRRLDTVAKTNRDAGRYEDRLVPQVFLAQLTAASSQAAVSGRNWWTYEWKEVERDDTGGTFSDVDFGRNSSKNGVAWNVYETSVDNDGGNTVGTTVTRLVVPMDAVVPMTIESTGRAVFWFPNPVQVCP